MGFVFIRQNDTIELIANGIASQRKPASHAFVAYCELIIMQKMQ